MPAILARNPRAALSVVGAGPEADALRAQAARLGLEGRVSFLGALPQAALPDLYRRAAVFVAPFVEAASGDQEGLGLTMIEAAGCGCRLVLGDVEAIRGVFAGQPGARIVNARDPSRLAEACLAALAEPEAAGVPPALLERFDWSACAQAYGRRLAALARGEHA